MGTPFKMKGSPMQRNFGISPVKQDVTQKFTEGFSKNIHNYGKTNILTTTTPKGTSFTEVSKKTGVTVASGGGSPKVIKGSTSTLASGQKIPWDPMRRQVITKDMQKTFKNVKKPKTNLVKNILGKAGRFLGGKALGVLGMMGAGTLSASAGNVGKKSEGQQIKDLLTKNKLKGGN